MKVFVLINWKGSACKERSALDDFWAKTFKRLLDLKTKNRRNSIKKYWMLGDFEAPRPYRRVRYKEPTWNEVIKTQNRSQECSMCPIIEINSFMFNFYHWLPTTQGDRECTESGKFIEFARFCWWIYGHLQIYKILEILQIAFPGRPVLRTGNLS
jgi:hypothetical protein